MTTGTEALLQVSDLIKTYPAEEGGFLGNLFSSGSQRIPALNGVSFELREGETLGLIGESGSGKSALARIIAGQEKPDKGRVNFMGKLINTLAENDLKAIKRNLRYLPEDAFGNLTADPKNRVDRLLYDLADRAPASGGASQGLAREMLDRVGLGEQYLTRFPNQMSGGERQRLAIAHALMLRPRLIVADEPVSNLDLTSRTQMLNLMKRIGREYKIAFIFISHNPSMVRYFAGSGRLAVMFAGRFVEQLPASDLFDRATHPYTKTLLSVNSTPSPLPASAIDLASALSERARVDAHTMPLDTLETEMSAEGNIGALAQVAATSVGCPFYRWCPEHFERCTQLTPRLLPVKYARLENGEVLPLEAGQLKPANEAACLRYTDQQD